MALGILELFFLLQSKQVTCMLFSSSSAASFFGPRYYMIELNLIIRSDISHKSDK